MNKLNLAGLALLSVISACHVVPRDMTPILLSRDKLTASALDKPYANLVSLIDTNLGPSAVESAFGPMIGRYFLTDDFSVYRHLKVVEQLRTPQQSATERVLGTAVDQSRKARFEPFEQLTYFLVNPDGFVTGIASGRLSARTTHCIIVDPETELPSRCDDPDRLEADLRQMDASVRTFDGLTISSWAVGDEASGQL